MKMIRDFLNALKEVALEYLKSRIFPVTVIMIVLAAVLLHRLFVLQIREGGEYSRNYTVKTEKTLTVDSVRGNIYDCNGKVLATNKVAYTLVYGNDTSLPDTAASLRMSENQLKNRILNQTLDILRKNGDRIDATLHISYKDGKYSYDVSGQPLLNFLKDVYAVTSADDLTKKQKNATAAETVAYLRDLFEIDNSYDDARAMEILTCRFSLWLNRFQQYVPVGIAHNISADSRAAITEKKDELLGMDIQTESSRVYNDAEYFAHIIGYVGKASQDEIDTLNAEDTGITYNSDDVVGKTGIEKVYETRLHGQDGEQVLNVDNLGKVIDVIRDTPASSGDDVYLTIDSDLQKYCYDMLEKELSNILVSKILNLDFNMADDDDKNIPITDVYAALFGNHLISLEAMGEESASARAKTIYQNYISTRDETLSTLQAELTDAPSPLNTLPAQYQDYSEYICEMLRDSGLYDTTKADHESREFKNYTEGRSSLQDFLRYLIEIQAIDTSSIQEKGKYYDSDDDYALIRDYVLDDLKDDETFENRIIRNMIKAGTITGDDCIRLLYQQGSLKEDGDAEYESYIRGELSAYGFFISKIKSLDITPAMLNLTPCSGSVVVTDVSTGAVKALVSYPSYDNNYLTNSVDPDYYARLLADHTNPLYNRACLLRTAPGSTFKIVSTVAGVSEGVLGIDETITDLGVFDKVYTKPQCWIWRQAHTTHGTIDISRALDVSCNYFFYEVGYRLATRNGVYDDDAGLAALRKYASQFALTQKSGIELDEMDPHFSTNDAVTSAIGQGTNSFTPVQLSRYITTVANSGSCYKLTLLDHISDDEGNVVLQQDHKPTSTVTASSALWDKIHTGMRMVVTDDLFTDKLLNSIHVEVAGKTGTAQVSEDEPANALFLSYAPYENPEVSVTAVIPNGYSSGNAAELTGFIYAYMYDKEALADATFQEDSQVGD